ncbi:MAG: hypothetical protein WKF79_14150 [Nocardioides sp.]
MLLGVLAIGTSLPFVAEDQASLWSAAPTTHAVTTKFAVMVLLVVLLWGAIAADAAPWQGLVQLVAAILACLAVVFGPEAGSGGTLIGMTGLLAAVTGIGALLTVRRSRT